MKILPPTFKTHHIPIANEIILHICESTASLDFKKNTSMNIAGSRKHSETLCGRMKEADLKNMT